MRTPLLIGLLSSSLSVSLTACSWTQFDDLRDEAWVNATERPDNGSTNWGLAITTSRLESATGGRLSVLGSAESIYSEIEYDATGGAKIPPTEQELGSFGVPNLDRPFLLSDPATNEVAIIVGLGTAQSRVLHGVDGVFAPYDLFGPGTVDAATFMVAPGFNGTGAAQPSQPLVGSGSTLFGVFYNPPAMPFRQPQCALVDGGPVTIAALGATRPAAATTDDILVWSVAGTLYRLPGDAFNGGDNDDTGCPDAGNGMAGDAIGQRDLALAPDPKVDIGFNPGPGSQILPFGDGLALLAGRTDSGSSHLVVVDVNTMTVVGTPQTESGLAQAAVYVDGAKTAVVAGYPAATIDGVTSGKVMVYEIDASGIKPDPFVLHDAEPEDDQFFGRAVAAIPYNGTRVIAVGASNEVFLYFRTEGPEGGLYPETRQGR